MTKKIDNIDPLKNISGKNRQPDDIPDISSTASTADCTGMMYAPPLNEEEYNSYQEIYNLHMPEEKEKHK